MQRLFAYPVELLVVQPTSFCNLNCSYCYVPERVDSSRMSVDTIRQLRTVLENSSVLDSNKRLEVLWHAGEPLAAGINFYKQAQDLLLFPLRCRREIIEVFQTNGTFITNDWCEYFLEAHALVGVSLDGPEEINDAQRAYRNGKGSFKLAVRGLELLRNHGIALNVLCVLTPATLSQPDRIFHFLLSLKITNVGFNVEEVEGEHRATSIEIGMTPSDVRQKYMSFMKRLISLNRQNGFPIFIREFKAQSQHLWNRAHNKCFFPDEAEHHAGKIITISRDGEVFSWSPELASGFNGDVAYFSLGNIHDVDSIDVLLNGARAKDFQREIDKGIDRCKQTCRYFNVCGGGSPANKFYENRTFTSTDTVKCRLQVQALTDVILSSVS